MMLHDILVGHGRDEECSDACGLFVSVLSSFLPHSTSPVVVKEAILNNSEVRRVVDALLKPRGYQLK